MELLGKKFKPIIELYDKFIEDNPDLLILVPRTLPFLGMNQQLIPIRNRTVQVKVQK